MHSLLSVTGGGSLFAMSCCRVTQRWRLHRAPCRTGTPNIDAKFVALMASPFTLNLSYAILTVILSFVVLILVVGHPNIEHRSTYLGDFLALH